PLLPRRSCQARQGARPDAAAIDPRPHRRGHRMMWRRVFRLALLLVQLWVVSDSVAQAPEKVYRLGVLSVSPGTLQRLRAVMFPELARLGFTEGRNLVVEARFGPIEELPALARQLAGAHPDAIIAAGNAIGAAQQATGTTATIGSFTGDALVAT